jgi:hypothetical protein
MTSKIFLKRNLCKKERPYKKEKEIQKRVCVWAYKREKNWRKEKDCDYQGKEESWLLKEKNNVKERKLVGERNF